MKAVVALALVVSSFSGPALAAPRSQKSDPGRRVCVTETVVGSRLARRVCKTAAEWEQDRREAREMLEKATRTQTNPTG
jgi:hypothetical protein